MGAGCCKEEEIDFNAEVELSHFHLLRSVGKGAFGKVRVVQHKKSKILYALKYINKEKCIKMRAVENIIQERRLLEEIEHSLICNLRYAFQDDENMFMVLDLMLGGDLRFHLERQGNLKEEVVKFYVAEISLGLNYLHSKKIVHRDLKPDNVLLDERGHAHLTDFNIAVHFNEKKPLTSIAGSMAYMAPEILRKKGYFNSVDWWSLGVVMYELLFSKRPFRGKTNTALTQAILHDPLRFPEDAKEHVSDDCINVIKRFCERDINKRLGCNGIDEIKQHPWFSNIEWDKLCTKQANPPFVPDSKRANFDATHELEELLLEDNPLKAKKRANPNQDLSELSKEVRMMEEKFLMYDFSKMSRKSYYKYSPENMKRQRITEQKIYNDASSEITVNRGENVRTPSTLTSSHGRQESEVTAVTSVEYKTKSETMAGDVQTKQSFENGRSGTNIFSNSSNDKRGHVRNMSSFQDINKKGVPTTFLSAHSKSSSLTIPPMNYHSSRPSRYDNDNNYNCNNNSNNNNNNNNNNNYNNDNNNNCNDNNNTSFPVSKKISSKSSLNKSFTDSQSRPLSPPSPSSPPLPLSQPPIPLQLLSVTTRNTSQLQPSQQTQNLSNDHLSRRSNSRSSSRTQSPLPLPSHSPSVSTLPSPSTSPLPSPLPSPQMLPRKFSSRNSLRKSFMEYQNNIDISSPPPLPPPNSPLPPTPTIQRQLFHQNISSPVMSNFPTANSKYQKPLSPSSPIVNSNNNFWNYPKELNSDYNNNMYL